MIKNIRLKNFKCFTDETFQLEQLTLLTGINGMGKSSVIQSLLLLKQSFANNYLQTQNKVTLSNNSFIDLENCEELCYKKAFPKTVEIELQNEEGANYKWIIDASIPNEKEPNFNFEGQNNYANESIFQNSFIYLSAERLGPRKSYSLHSAERNYNTILGIQGELAPAYIQKAITENKELYIENLIHPSLKEDKSQPLENSSLLYKNLNAWLSDILGRTVTAKVSSIDKDNVKLSFSLKGIQGGEFSALQVGFGFSFSLPVILAPLLAKPGDLIIIENPEAHLHPSAQAKIGRLLAIAANNGVQVILETHSDHVLNGIRLATKEKLISNKDIKIYFWGGSENNNNSKEEPEIDENGRITKWPRYFFDTWENSLMELL